ncbi:TlpA disulfide reductase family protein [uncultured Croceitalea sp.]|uniref:TlpA family protein disulfide reductase n=1 Tax=uncultured Croceitalea sp. TaxID=1798908 RepID=UPI0033067AB2
MTELLELSADGSFTDTLSTDQSSYELYDGKNIISLYVKPGYNLNIFYDTENIDSTMVFQGDGSKENTYMFEKRKKTNAFIGDPYEVYKLDETEYKTKFKALKNNLLDFLKEYEGLSDDFKLAEENNVVYDYLSKLSEYERIHMAITKNRDFKVSESFLDELKDFDYTNENDYNFSKSYKDLVGSKLKKQAQNLAKTDSIDFDIAYLKTASAVENSSIKNDKLFTFTHQMIGFSKDINAFYDLFKEHSTNATNNDLIAEKYNKLMALSKGNPSPKFKNYKNYVGGTTSLDDLKGKYVYIDVWATWCGPCIREIPSLKEVEKKYHQKNIAFVSLSVDEEKDHEKWKAMVKEKELGGVQLFADKNFDSQFVKDYEIQGIPRFILIDPTGNIVDSNAPRPSSPKLIDLFNELNI